MVMPVHGGDLATVGPKVDLDLLEAWMQEHFALTMQPRMGQGPQDAKEWVILNRAIRWTESGIECEADVRQAEKLVAETGMTGTNTRATPGLRLSLRAA